MVDYTKVICIQLLNIMQINKWMKQKYEIDYVKVFIDCIYRPMKTIPVYFILQIRKNQPL